MTLKEKIEEVLDFHEDHHGGVPRAIYESEFVHLVTAIHSLIEQECIKAEIKVHREYIKECPMGFELYAEERIEQLQSMIKEE